MSQKATWIPSSQFNSCWNRAIDGLVATNPATTMEYQIMQCTLHSTLIDGDMVSRFVSWFPSSQIVESSVCASFVGAWIFHMSLLSLWDKTFPELPAHRQLIIFLVPISADKLCDVLSASHSSHIYTEYLHIIVKLYNIHSVWNYSMWRRIEYRETLVNSCYYWTEIRKSV